MARDVNIRVRVDDREIRRLRSAVRRLRAMVAATGGAGVGVGPGDIGLDVEPFSPGTGTAALAGANLGGGRPAPAPGDSGPTPKARISPGTKRVTGLPTLSETNAFAYARMLGSSALLDRTATPTSKWEEYRVLQGMSITDKLHSDLTDPDSINALKLEKESLGWRDGYTRGMSMRRHRIARQTDTQSPLYRTAGNIGQVSSSPHTIITDRVTGRDASVPRYVWTDPLQETTTIAGNRQPIRGALRSATGPVSSTLGAALGRTVAVAGAQGNIPREGLNQAVEEFRGTFKPFTDRAKGMWKTFFSKPTGSFNPFGFDKVAEKFDQIGGIASAGALLATSKKFADERSSYFKNLLTTDNAVPSSSILQQQINASVTAASDLMANFTYTSMFEVPSMFLSLGNSAFNSGDKSYEMALDMVGMQWKETLGLNEDGYKQVFGAQQQWAAAWSQQEEALNRAADQNSAALTDSLEGMGLSGVSTRDFQQKFRKTLFYRSAQKARREFELENPYPTAKDVNPYGVDGLSKRDVRLWADGLNPLTDF